MKKIRLTHALVLLAVFLVPITTVSVGHGQKIRKPSDSLEGTTWETTTGDAGVTYNFKKDNVVTETWEDVAGKKTKFEGAYTHNDDSVKIEFSDHTINAKIEGEWMKGTVILKDGTVSWSAKKK